MSAEESDVGRRAQQEGHVQPAEEAVSAALLEILKLPLEKQRLSMDTRSAYSPESLKPRPTFKLFMQM